ncbi:transcription factor E2F6 [Pundamilia nyererei]|uniref:Transcription factor E2F6-like n=1 Tax=Pundamilia nyererei TaxID=303518 RepID=A0A3B4ET19_9CICH|nr:PREDICTED: transcription factor E2F6-like [Pundamilia nyererei]
MVKCVVSGCPNRMVNVSRGLFNRPKKRFFNFPQDPARVQVWLAALRETEKQDSVEQHLICEDHFLPEDISDEGVSSDAIPIMPPCLDGALGLLSQWGAESSEEEDQWAAGGGGGEEEEEEEEEDVNVPVIPFARRPTPHKQEPDAKTNLGTKREILSHLKEMIQTRISTRQDASLGVLTVRFLELLLMSPDGTIDLREVTKSLQTRRRRVYDITNVLEGFNVIEKQTANKVKWIGSCPISSFLLKSRQKFQRELENLKLVEDTLDSLIKSCAQQLFDMTDEWQNALLAYVTHEDISRLEAFQEQTVIVVKAPEETKLEVPAPTEDSIQVHLKGGKGPIMMMTCDIGTGEAVTEEMSGCFVTLEESRIKTTTLHRETSISQSPTQST